MDAIDAIVGWRKGLKFRGIAELRHSNLESVLMLPCYAHLRAIAPNWSHHAIACVALSLATARMNDKEDIFSGLAHAKADFPNSGQRHIYDFRFDALLKSYDWPEFYAALSTIIKVLMQRNGGANWRSIVHVVHDFDTGSNWKISAAEKYYCYQGADHD
ncbi:type I-E CRISPR-associated protein Cse2/CasB [Methylocaldum gracile]|jgi:hypothetical protein|uniref:type I-E CRISPR-associated protein Cse2/CasB n=1 Tax=Methylocaldum sp. 0917 TaxID=2485163 RepID=UPI0010618B29